MFETVNKLIFFILLMSVTTSAYSAPPSSYLNDKNLSEYGYSDEVIRLVNLAKARNEGDFDKIPNQPSRLEKFLFNIKWDPDITSRTKPFGHDKIHIK